MTDPIGDFIIRIKNAGKVRKDSVSAPFSKMKMAIAEVLSAKGFLGEVEKKTKGKMVVLSVGLLYGKDGKPLISEVRRISQPGQRIYEKAEEVKKYRRGFCISVV